MGGPRITPAVAEAICRFYADAGLSLRELAAGFGLRPYSVSRVLRRHGIPRRRAGHHAWSRSQYKLEQNQ